MKRTALHRLFALGKDRSGAVTVEFAVVSIAVMVFLPLIWDLTSVISSTMALNGSMRAGIQFALSNPNDSTGITQVIKTASGLNTSTLTVSTSQSCNCSGVA